MAISRASRKKVLVANRGEIACRVMRTCERLGIATVGVFSDADTESKHVKMANEVQLIGPPRAQESYLVVDRIIAAAKETGANAIHPGYGFLSENAGFARAVINAGITWIGPDPASIDTMGDKQRARQAAIAASVPVVPGSSRFELGALDGIDEAAASIGFPLIAKAAGGGGGIGMRRIESEDKLREVVEATQSMALKAFGNGSVYLERFIESARHVEVQVFGFGDGHAIHLFERDCSLQRRFQKVIEETPAPGLRSETLSRMYEFAVALTKAAHYRGAGTIEFIVDTKSEEFFFLEMNTRIQVEHPVTEMVTELDLVELQISLAYRELSLLTQDSITRQGASIEARVYAENPRKQFMPSPGQLNVFKLPAESADLRIDTGFREGDVVTPYYDPLVAKIITWGQDREAARLRAIGALQSCQIEGIACNLAFLAACLGHEEFRAGNVDTDFIGRHRKTLVE